MSDTVSRGIYMTSLKIVEWNINQRAVEAIIKGFVVNEILAKDPDVIVLVEFKGKHNFDILQRNLDEYYHFYYNGCGSKSNGIYIALKKSKFMSRQTMDFNHQKEPDSKKQPNWARITCQLKSDKGVLGKTLNIIGTRIITGPTYSRKELIDRKGQIEWLLSNNNNCKRQIIIGDFNYGPHVTEWDSKFELNWQDIIQVFRDHGYLGNQEHSPYSPVGTSWKSEKLDWLITKGVKVSEESDYNRLDWSFGKHYKDFFVDGYLVPGQYFIRTKPSYPDHAMFSVEVEV